jgi:hypothetical protein
LHAAVGAAIGAAAVAAVGVPEGLAEGAAVGLAVWSDRVSGSRSSGEGCRGRRTWRSNGNCSKTSSR